MMSVFHRLFVISAALVSIAAAATLGQAVGTAEASAAEPPVCEKAAEPTKTAFLGVITSKPPRIMIEQLGLQPDVGLVVIALAPESPASKSGLAVNDIITDVGDSAIHAPQDLTKVIQQRTPGEVVRLKLIRKGEPVELDATLGSRPAGSKDAGEIDKLLRKLIEERVAAGESPKELEQLAKRIEQQVAKGGEAMEIPVGASIRIIDEEGCVELKTNEDSKEIIVRDKENKIVWSGPWNNAAEKKAAPAEVARRFRELDIETIFESSRIRLILPGTKKSAKLDSDPLPEENANR